MNEALAVKDSTSSALAPMSINNLLAQVALIQEVMKTVMKAGEHYGKVPGCGDKPALFKAGAEKLCFVFRLAPKYEIQERTFESGHREYRVKCTLTTIGSSMFVGEGEGIASTMEAKYRFRTGPKKSTGKPVPQMYWAIRDKQPEEAKKLIGGPGFSTAKNEAGVWEIVEVGGKVEHDNPADYYNTVLKMAQKRAHVAVTLTATAASDIFAQDLEDLEETIRTYDADIEAHAPGQQTAPASGGTNKAASEPNATGTTATTAGTAQTGQQAGQQSNAGTGWRAFPVPKFIKKYFGKTLGDMTETDLAWWGKNYQAKGFGNQPPSAADLELRKMLDLAIAEMRKNAGEAVQGVIDKMEGAPAGTAAGGSEQQMDVPY